MVILRMYILSIGYSLESEIRVIPCISNILEVFRSLHELNSAAVQGAVASVPRNLIYYVFYDIEYVH